MTQEKYRELFAGLREELGEAEQQEGGALHKMVACLLPVRRAIARLREWVLADGFVSEASEIEFFKTCKPAFFALQIYYVELGTVGDGLPQDAVLRETYLREQLVFIERFFRQQAFLYQYFKLGAADLDRFYFLRQAVLPDMLMTEMPGCDPEFSTPGDYLFAKFMAYERLREHIGELLSAKEGSTGSFTSKKGKALRWTGDTCNLIEVAYGFYDTLQINDGEADLTDIIDWLESTLDVNLSRFYRRFMEIKRRKVLSKTKYLDEMRAAVNKRIDDTDAYQAEKRRSFRNR